MQNARCRVQWLMNWHWVAAVSFDWFPALCLPPLIVYLGSGTPTRPLTKLRPEDTMLCLTREPSPLVNLNWSYLGEIVQEM